VESLVNKKKKRDSMGYETMLEKRLLVLKKQFCDEASFVQDMLEVSIRALFKKDSAALLKIIKHDEPIVNNLDIEIEKQCTQIIALYQPEAKNLRLVLMVLKANYDLERIADHAVNIAQSALAILEYDIGMVQDIVHTTAECSLGMLKDALHAFINEEDLLAQKVLARDDVVDNLRDKCVKTLGELLKQNPGSNILFAHILRIVRSLERVADLSTNIAEYTLFVLKGTIVKHGKDEQL